ncbi:MAG: glycogen/starch/alpha-glucan phosphorylase [Alphaproteobacteria bacterium]|nr:glycogen/starch/alpha-glucan phosphorylase [Alphaproteobacteria bacterium]
MVISKTRIKKSENKKMKSSDDIMYADARYKTAEGVKESLVRYMMQVVGRDPKFADKNDWYKAVSYLLRGYLSHNYLKSARNEVKDDYKRMYYLSMEYLPGKNLRKFIIDADMESNLNQALEEFKVSIDDLEEFEPEPALGNGGLGRLASCFFDSIATHGYPGHAYGIRYEYGLFRQSIENGEQKEYPENWLTHGYPFEFERSELVYPISFGGEVVKFINNDGKEQRQWEPAERLKAVAFDIPVSGYKTESATSMRLWSARADSDFNLDSFNTGNYIDAVKEKTNSESLSKVLYPEDSTLAGQVLRFKQEYFSVSASVQDIIRRFLRTHSDFNELPEEVSIHLNDTHPTLAIVELIRILVDEHGLHMNDAWRIAQGVFSYTNHTLMAEAMETWPISVFEELLPRHLDIIYYINQDFMDRVKVRFPGDLEKLSQMSLIDDADRRVRMAFLCIVSSHHINGVSELHSQLMKDSIFNNFYQMFPERFTNVTNGITPRRWVRQANPKLAGLITKTIGSDNWVTNLDLLTELNNYSSKKSFTKELLKIKSQNKERLANYIKEIWNIDVDTNSMFDIQVKRIHEYKRQLLNVLHIITRYNRIKSGQDLTKRTIVIAGKAAPAYKQAKLIIRLINDIAVLINNNEEVNDKLKVVYITDYNVSKAQIIIPAADLSEQISLAGLEASGTGNMKFSMNGALTIGTMDGANVEIANCVGEENIFIFGLRTPEVADRKNDYDPRYYYDKNSELREVIDMIGSGYFNPENPERYQDIVNSLLNEDKYMLLADYESYVQAQEKVDACFENQSEWAEKSVINIANMGFFSSDNSVANYAKNIWNLKKTKK